MRRIEKSNFIVLTILSRVVNNYSLTLARAGDVNSALALLSSAISSPSPSSRVSTLTSLINYGAICFAGSLIQDCEKIYDQIISEFMAIVTSSARTSLGISPSEAFSQKCYQVAFNNRGVVSGAQGKLDEAVSFFEKAAKLSNIGVGTVDGSYGKPEGGNGSSNSVAAFGGLGYLKAELNLRLAKKIAVQNRLQLLQQQQEQEALLKKEQEALLKKQQEEAARIPAPAPPLEFPNPTDLPLAPQPPTEQGFNPFPITAPEPTLAVGTSVSAQSAFGEKKDSESEDWSSSDDEETEKKSNQPSLLIPFPDFSQQQIQPNLPQQPTAQDDWFFSALKGPTPAQNSQPVEQPKLLSPPKNEEEESGSVEIEMSDSDSDENEDDEKSSGKVSQAAPTASPLDAIFGAPQPASAQSSSASLTSNFTFDFSSGAALFNPAAGNTAATTAGTAPTSDAWNPFGGGISQPSASSASSSSTAHSSDDILSLFDVPSTITTRKEEEEEKDEEAKEPEKDEEEDSSSSAEIEMSDEDEDEEKEPKSSVAVPATTPETPAVHEAPKPAVPTEITPPTVPTESEFHPFSSTSGTPAPPQPVTSDFNPWGAAPAAVTSDSSTSAPTAASDFNPFGAVQATSPAATSNAAPTAASDFNPFGDSSAWATPPAGNSESSAAPTSDFNPFGTSSTPTEQQHQAPTADFNPFGNGK